MRFRDVDNPDSEMGMVTVNDHSEEKLEERSDEDMREEESSLKNKASKSCT
ncbi:hypothetical protein SESBI_33860 [Sesbania bispinosa]|nr:hypothetical protein SESBI_33860 [Sesbania bispinosa]